MASGYQYKDFSRLVMRISWWMGERCVGIPTWFIIKAERDVDECSFFITYI